MAIRYYRPLWPQTHCRILSRTAAGAYGFLHPLDPEFPRNLWQRIPESGHRVAPPDRGRSYPLQSVNDAPYHSSRNRSWQSTKRGSHRRAHLRSLRYSLRDHTVAASHTPKLWPRLDAPGLALGDGASGDSFRRHHSRARFSPPPQEMNRRLRLGGNSVSYYWGRAALSGEREKFIERYFLCPNRFRHQCNCKL